MDIGELRGELRVGTEEEEEEGWDIGREERRAWWRCELECSEVGDDRGESCQTAVSVASVLAR